ncbi:MAG: transglycosylase domain-containing protein [Flavobacteriales bacterium]|jgi:penicillin-binding protein 1A|nr:transglycosylase domain-containing protein [Flavobacteriales bacterium]
MAKKRSAKRRKKATSGTSWAKVMVIAIALVIIAFFTFMQLVRSGFFGKLPTEEELTSITHEQATLVLASDGTLIGKLFAEDRTNVKHADLPQHLIDALVATEDARFFQHEGVDGRSYFRVFFRTLLGRDKSGGGGSTISQQIIKNLYGRQRHGPLTVPVNKMKEALVAQRLERVLTKNDVLVLYFNSVPFGENVFGIEAAAQRFFGKPAKRLNVQESAVLVGMLKANTTYNPRLYPEKARGRRDQVLALMHTRGHLTQVQLDSLKQLPIKLRYTGGDALDLYGYFNAQVAKEAKAILADVGKRTGTAYDIEKDGLRITTTLDPVLQRSAHMAVHKHLAAMQPKLDKELRNAKARAAWEKKIPRKGPRWTANEKMVREVYHHAGRRVDTLTFRDSLWHYHKLLNGAVLMMDPGSGAVRAWVGGNDHRYLPYDLVTARRQVASTIKPVVHAAAMERGLTPCDYLDNARKSYAEYDDWTPDNFDRDTLEGEVALWYALAKSMNRPTVDLYFRTGTDTLRRTFEALGLPTADVDKPAVALGASSISLKELVPAYGAFAMRGQRVDPRLIAKITDANGQVVYEAEQAAGKQAIAAESAAAVTAMLQRAIDQGTGTALRTRYGVKAPLAGKTGTSQDHTDAWFVAYTPGLVVGTWVGAFDPSVHFSSKLGTGSQLALPIAGMVLKDIEGNAELRRKYLRDFGWVADYAVDMDCDPRRHKSGLQQLLEDVFGPGHKRDVDTLRKVRKDQNFFDRLFKKKR